MMKRLHDALRMMPVVAVAVGLMGPGVSARAADIDKGADSFDANCGDCHSLSSKLKNRKGPSLYGVYNRKAGSVPGFEYSLGMVQSGFVWTAEKLDAYLANPKAVVPDGIMKFKGLPSAAERADLIAFLATQKP